MSSLFGAINDIAKGARFATDVAKWVGHKGIRQYRSGKNGVCLICNNLQPHGHEDTFGRAGARWHSNPGNWSILPEEPRAASGAAGILVLTDISPKKLLEVRQKDKQTGLPNRSCRYCQLLCEIFDAFFVDEYMSWVSETENGMDIEFGLMIQEGRPLIINCYNFTYDKYIWKPRVDLEVYLDMGPGQMVAIPGAPSIGPTGTRAEYVGSEGCISFMKNCVQQCFSEHRACAAQATNFVPTRLIYLGTSNEEVRICEYFPGNSSVLWVALSHCWGGGQPFKLQKGNIDALKQHLSFSDLPATFQNGIQVTRELGLHYIWIDSLCIIQDDKADWDREAALMGMVYSQAFVVVSAASSQNPETPFLGRREEDWLPKKFEFETEQGYNIPITVRQRHLLAAPLEQGIYEPPFTSPWATLKRPGKLFERGWCFQESFLANRIVHFSPGAIIFECQTHRRSEDQLPPFPLLTPGTFGEVDDGDKWRMVVKVYTQRQLTFASDKLPAIAGAASRMPQSQRSAYLAGLWRESLLLDLMWQVMPGKTHTALTFPSSEQSAPSWSWASMDRGIVWNPLKSPQLLATVLAAETIVSGANPYGQVTAGHISLQGRVKPCFVSTSRQKNEQWLYYTKKDGTQSKKQHFRADGQLMAQTMPGKTAAFARRARGGEWAPEIEAAAIFLCIARTPWANYNYVGLVLSTSPTVPGCLERVGSMTNVPSDWYNEGEITNITIV